MSSAEILLELKLGVFHRVEVWSCVELLEEDVEINVCP